MPAVTHMSINLIQDKYCKASVQKLFKKTSSDVSKLTTDRPILQYKRTYSLVHLVVPKMEEPISRLLLVLFIIRLLFQNRVRSQNLRFEWQCSSDHFFVLIQRTRPFSIEIGIEIEGFPVLKTTSICQSCNKSIRNKQANPSTDTAI